MKKLLVILPVALSVAACSTDYTEYDSMMDGCERIETTAQHLVYKCPADLEWIQTVKQTPANGMFRTGGDNLNLAELYADKEHAYVEVALNDKGACEKDFTVRTMIAEPVAETNWAVISCK